LKIAELAKKRAEFEWREWNDLAEKTQELYRKASRTQTFATIKLGDGKNPACLVPFSDQHWGARGADYKIFRQMTEEIISTPNLYVGLVGDEVEFAIKLRSVAEVCAQIFGPDKQLQFMEEWVKEISPKLVFATWSNHPVEREEKQVGYSQIKNILADNTVMFDGIGHADIVVGKQTYKTAITHKFRGYSYQNTCHAGQRYMRFEGIDREIAIMGDIHQPAYNCYFDGPARRLSLVAGTLNTESLYAKRYFSIFSQPEYPCIEFRHDCHEFTPFPTLGSWKMNRGINNLKKST
jgi:hypothetical protein